MVTGSRGPRNSSVARAPDMQALTRLLSIGLFGLLGLGICWASSSASRASDTSRTLLQLADLRAGRLACPAYDAHTLR